MIIHTHNIRRIISAELLFLISACSQYIGAAVAVGLFDQVAPRTVAWLRVVGASIVLLTVAGRFWHGWNHRRLIAAALFGTATGLMNLFFYMAIARIDLGKGVAIEFIGPIVVAAVSTRTIRNAAALALATVGVITLGGAEISSDPAGVLFILLASALWAAYIVIGSKVALEGTGLVGLGAGLAIGSLVLTPIGAPGSAAVWASPSLLAVACATGVFSNAIGYGIDQHVLRQIPVRRFSLLLAMLPVTAVAIGWFALDQQPSALDACGIALVLLGVTTQEREKVTPPDPS